MRRDTFILNLQRVSLIQGNFVIDINACCPLAAQVPAAIREEIVEYQLDESSRGQRMILENPIFADLKPLVLSTFIEYYDKADPDRYMSYNERQEWLLQTAVELAEELGIIKE